MPKPPADHRSILIIKWSALGDVALATVVMEDLRRAFPAARIDLNTMSAAARLFEADARFGEVFAIDLRERGFQLARARQWLRRVRAGRYDLIVDLQRNDRSRLMLGLLRLSGCRAQIWGKRQVRGTRPASAIDTHRRLLAAGGVRATTRAPALHVPPAQREMAADCLRRLDLRRGEYAVLLPGSQRGGALKRWGKERFAELGRLLLAQGLRRIAVIGGPDEAAECQAIAAAIGEAAVHLDAPPLLQLPVLCETAAVVVGNDTGLAHIAAAACRPLVVLCGPTDPRRVKPAGDEVVALQARAECVNCYARQCRFGAEAACLAAIAPRAVSDFIVRGRRDASLQYF